MPIKPTNGFPTRTAAVLAYRAQGKNTAQIADLIGINTNTVLALEGSAARKKGAHGPDAREEGRAVLVPLDILGKLRRPAEKRGVTPNRLARLIIEAVVDGNIVDAVLDDADEEPAPTGRGRVI